MKVLLYFENESMIQTSGIGRAMKHQETALTSVGIPWTIDPNCEDYDILHVNTVGPNSANKVREAHQNGKKVIYHAHSTEEDFRNSFVLSNQIAPVYKKILVSAYSSADYIITPTIYSKKLLENYGITVPISAISNGIDLGHYQPDNEKVKAYRNYLSVRPDEKIVMGVGLFFERKGLLDFIEVAKRLPQYRFVWFGNTALVLIPQQMRDIVSGDHPSNVYFPGYVKGPIIEGAYQGSDAFFFPSYEETEGIVVLEALASKQQVIVRDIGAYEGWLEDKENCYFGHDNDEFTKLVKGVVEKELPDVSGGAYKVAESRSLDKIGIQLKAVYEKVLKA